MNHFKVHCKRWMQITVLRSDQMIDLKYKIMLGKVVSMSFGTFKETK